MWTPSFCDGVLFKKKGVPTSCFAVLAGDLTRVSGRWQFGKRFALIIDHVIYI